MESRLSIDTIITDALEVRELDHPRNSQQSISSRSMTSLVTGTTASRTLYKNVTVFEPWNNSDSKNIFKNPKIILTWIYSISLILFSLLVLLLVSVTVIDVIAQTTTTKFSGIKVFIVIIVCVAFVLYAIIVYFLRIFQTRIALNDIPLKSAYIPFEGDYPHTVYKAINSKLEECAEIRIRAGPLSDDSIIINHPGLAPPEYVQQRNRNANIVEGTYLPPDSVYEEIIRSIGDKFISGKMISPDIPREYTLREILLYLKSLYVHNNEVETSRLIELYEKFRFGPELIQESELIEFMLSFDKLAQLCLSDYTQNLKEQGRNRTSLHTLDDLNKFDDGYSKDFGFHDDYYDYDYDYESQDPSEGTINSAEVDTKSSQDYDRLNNPFQHEEMNDKYFRDIEQDYQEDEEDTNDGSSEESYNPTRRKLTKSSTSNLYPPRRSSQRSLVSGQSLQLQGSIKSRSRSIIRNKLALKTETNTSEDSVFIGIKDLDYDEHRNYTLNKEKEELDELHITPENKHSTHYEDLFGSSSSDEDNEFYSFRKRP